MSEIGTCVRLINKGSGYSFLTGEIIQCQISKKIIFHTGRYESTSMARTITMSTSGHYIDDCICEEFAEHGVEQIWIYRSYVDVSPKYYNMIAFKMGGSYILREDTDVDRLVPNSRVCIDRDQRGYMCDKIYELIINNESNGRRLIINNDKTFVDLLRNDTIKWIVDCGNIVSVIVNEKEKMSLPVMVNHSSIPLAQSWWRRIVHDNIRKRDIPGFERELIDMGLEHLL